MEAYRSPSRRSPSWQTAVVLLFLVASSAGVIGGVRAQLSGSFYSSTCPNVETLVRQAVETKFQQTFVTIPATLRLFFHDCFVEGCDASVMIQSPRNDAEKDAPDNLSLAGDGFDTVVKAKQAVEASCPGVVSCADVLALAARDVVVLAGGQSFGVELGRKDGRISSSSRVSGNLPGPDDTLDKLTSLFTSKGLSQTDMVALSGAHTVGFSHCNRFANRIYSDPIDPSLDPSYAQELRQMCPRDVDPTIAINMDPATPRTFDNAYYRNLAAGKGLFKSDQVLFTDEATKGVVSRFASNGGSFGRAFGEAMVRLGRVEVKTGAEGEIRRDCSAFN